MCAIIFIPVVPGRNGSTVPVLRDVITSQKSRVIVLPILNVRTVKNI
jgi:hypothetical protein